MDIQQGTSKTVRLVPPAPMTSPIATVYDRARNVLVTPTATPSTVDTTVAAGDSTTDELVLASGVGLTRGSWIRVTDAAFGDARSEVSSVDGAVVRLVDPLPAVPSVGAVVEGLDVAVTLTGAATASLYMSYVLEVSDGVDAVRLVYNVVVYPYVGPCDDTTVRELLARAYPSELELVRDTARHARIAREVNAAIRGRLLASKTYISGYWSPDALSNVCAPMLRLVLAERYGLREGGSDRDQYLTSLRFEVRDRIAELIQSSETHDDDNDGIVDDDEHEAGRFSIRLVN